MKKINLLFMMVLLTMLGLESCDNQKTYAEMKEEEAEAIQAYITKNDITVITEEDFARQDSTTAENEYVLFEETGIYMNVVNRGNGKILEQGEHTVLSRFVEIALMDEAEMFSTGDTILANMHVNDRPVHMLYPEEMKITVGKDSYTGSFSTNNTSLMTKMYNTSAVPAGWMFPLRFIKPNRTNKASEIARVKMIVPHGQGTSTATQYVYPCFYEITYQMD